MSRDAEDVLTVLAILASSILSGLVFFLLAKLIP